MNIYGISSIYFVACLLLFIVHTISGEYSIGKTIPSYMFRKYDNVEEEIFPQDIRIKLILSKISGTLLYSIDKHMNQMIVSLESIEEATIEIEFRKTKNHIYLSKLCGCEDCQYEILEFFIQIKDTINLQCNNGSVQKYDYSTQKELNSEYPLPYSNKQVNPQSRNEAHLWLVNHQFYKDLYPNHYQMIGCIFEVKYKNIPIKFTSITDKIKQQCKRRCVDNICNGGMCHETFNGRPVCNCTYTFLNGPNCNDSLTSINLRGYGLALRFTLLKMSWKTMSKEIFTLSNNNLKIGLASSGKNLLFFTNHSKDFNTVINHLTFPGYVPNKESVLIASLSEKYIQIKLFFNGTIHYRSLRIITDFRNETFTNLTMRSEGGIIGIAYKPLSKNHKWRNVEIKMFEEIKNGLEVKIKRNISKKFTTHDPNRYSPETVTTNPQTALIFKIFNENRQTNTILIGIYFCLFVLFGIIIVVLVVLFRKLKRRGTPNTKDSSHGLEPMPLNTYSEDSSHDLEDIPLNTYSEDSSHDLEDIPLKRKQSPNQFGI